MKIPKMPYLVAQWRRGHTGDGQIFTQPWPAGPKGGRRDQVIHYQHKADRARRTLRGIDEQIAKAEQAAAGIKGYVTNLRACLDGFPVTADFVIGAYHRLFEIERSFRMTKGDLQIRPVYHRKRESIEAHLSIVLAALAVSRCIEHQTGWSIRKFVQTASRYAPFRSRPGRAPSPPPTPSQTTSANASIRSTAAADLRARAAEVRSPHRSSGNTGRTGMSDTVSTKGPLSASSEPQAFICSR
jgi:hypothetical protein